jgi:multiple sugar transport system ATP-binding protein
MATLLLQDLAKIYPNGTQAVGGVTLDIPDGCFCALLGPSGCGKSTLLRMIAGIESVTSGRIVLADKDITNMHPKDRDMAMVFQSYALYPHLTVEENIAFPLTMRKVEKTEKARRVAAAAEQLQLGGLMSRRPAELSGGQRQRVAVARAIVRQPKVFLFDEPLSNLDAKLRTSTRAELKQLHQRLRVTTVYVTHDQEEAMALGDLVVVMAKGRVQQAAAPLDLFEAPANRFVAGFIGTPSMNFFEATIDASGMVESGLGVALHAAGTAPRTTRAISLGIRPSAFRLVAAGESGTVGAEIEAVEPLGESMDLSLRIGASRAVARIPARRGLAAGDRIRLAVDVSGVHLFEARGEEERIACELTHIHRKQECLA